MTSDTQGIIGFIGGAQTLIEYFPVDIINVLKGKKYNSVIEFVIDVLHTLGVDDRTIIKKLIQKLFDIPSFNEVSSDIMEQISEADLESEFLNKLEDNTKTIISNVLTAILTCSINPEISNKFMDEASNKTNYGFITIPLSMIDYSGMLNICPLDKIGKNYYNVESGLTVNTLYKSFDMNSFIWYCLNRGISYPQIEKNKMVWDNRRVAFNEDATIRDTSEKWFSWYNSKTKSDGTLTLKNDILFPIVQLERENVYDNEKSLRVYISAQRYFKSGTFNRSIYRFNSDYLNSIRILSTKMILTNVVQELLGGLFLSNPINYSINQTIIDAKIDIIIKNILEGEDTQIEDCFYSFSNEEYDEMLQQYDMMRYNAKRLNSETSPAITFNVDNILNSLNSVSSAATSNEKIEIITKTIFDITAIPATDGAIIESDKIGLTYNNSWLNEIIRSIVRPIVRSIMSPQVMLLFIINLETTGIISLDKKEDMSLIMSLIYNKIFALLKSLIIYIKDVITVFFRDLIIEKLKPLITKYYALILTNLLIVPLILRHNT